MDRREFIAAAVAAATVALTSQASAQRGGAFLDRAIPGVGLTVSGPPRELRLNFTLGVIAALSDVQVTNASGAAIPASRPVNDPSGQEIVIVRFKRPLPPGTYTVSWRAVSILRRLTWGTFQFTVA